MKSLLLKVFRLHSALCVSVVNEISHVVRFTSLYYNGGEWKICSTEYACHKGIEHHLEGNPFF